MNERLAEAFPGQLRQIGKSGETHERRRIFFLEQNTEYNKHVLQQNVYLLFILFWYCLLKRITGSVES
jgi:hypothetical protein